MMSIITHHVRQRHKFCGLLGLLQYAYLHHHSRFWISVIHTILERKGEANG
jgi:hypothetical protein